MSNILSTCKKEANPAEEIELTDAQLVAVYGAWGDVTQNICEGAPVEHGCAVGGGVPAPAAQCSVPNAVAAPSALVTTPATQCSVPNAVSPSFAATSFHKKHTISFQLSFEKEEEVSKKSIVVG